MEGRKGVDLDGWIQARGVEYEYKEPQAGMAQAMAVTR